MCWGESETTASLLCRWDEQLGVIGSWCACQPCMSVYLPVYFTGYLPASLSAPGKHFDEHSLWWKTKRLILAVSSDENRFAPRVQKACAMLDVRLTAWAAQEEAVAKKLMAQGQREAAILRLNHLMDEAVKEACAMVDAQYASIREELLALGGIYGTQKEAIAEYCDYAMVPLL